MPSRTIAFLVVLVMAACAVAEATVVVSADLRKLTSNAQAIAHGRVADVRSQWSATGHRIETIVTVEVDGYLKGNLGSRVIFRVPGGKMGYLRSVTVGSPVVRQGDEIYVFLGATGPAIPHVIGFNQGVFRVSVEAKTGRRIVISPVLAGEVRGTRPITRGSAATMTTGDFEQQVRSIVSQQEPSNIAQPRTTAAGRVRR